MALHLTADTHIGHPGIIPSCARPFADVAAMDEALIAAWNATVAPGDDVIHVGDFAWNQGRTRKEEILARLNGRKYLVPGNHDDKRTLRLPWAGILPPLYEMHHAGEHITLCHYPLETWNRRRYGAKHFYGHVHGRIPGTSQSIDVGVDVWGYRPVPIERALAVMATLPPPGHQAGPARIHSYAEVEPGPAPSLSP